MRDQAIEVGITLRDPIASFYLPNTVRRSARRLDRRLPCLAIALLATSGLDGCRRPPPVTSAEAMAETSDRLEEDLALVPAEARLVVALDLDRLQATPAGAPLRASAARALERLFAGLASGAGVDVAEQARRLLVALPEERQADDRALAILDLRGLDRERATAWLRATPAAGATGFVSGEERLVLARGAWATATRAPSGALADHAARDQALRRLCERASRHPALWFAAIVPTSLRRQLIAEDRFPDVASVMRLHGGLRLDAGAHAELVLELSNAPDAKLLAHRLGSFLSAAKRHPELLARGLSPYLEAARVVTDGPAVRATVELPASEAGDLAHRLDDLVRAGSSRLPAEIPSRAARESQ